MMRRVLGLLVGLWFGAWSPAFAEIGDSDSETCCVQMAALSSPTASIARLTTLGVAIDSADDDLGLRFRLVAMIARLQEELDEFPAYARWRLGYNGLTPIRFPLR